jgi:hypothetical protein
MRQRGTLIAQFALIILAARRCLPLVWRLKSLANTLTRHQNLGEPIYAILFDSNTHLEGANDKHRLYQQLPCYFI